MVKLACKILVIGSLIWAPAAEAASAKSARAPGVQVAAKLTRAHARINKAKANRLTQVALIGIVAAGAGAAVGVAAAAGAFNSSN